MKLKLSKKFFLFLISGATAATLTVLACAGGDWDGTEGSMFSPDLIRQEEFTPFFRTVATPFFDGYDTDNSYKFGDISNAEWNKQYFNGAVTIEAIQYWMNSASLNQIDSMIFALKDK